MSEDFRRIWVGVCGYCGLVHLAVLDERDQVIEQIALDPNHAEGIAASMVKAAKQAREFARIPREVGRA